MKCWGRRMVCVAVVLCIFFLFPYRSSGEAASMLLQTQLFNLSLVLQPASAEDAAKHCIKDPALQGPGVLAPATLLLYVLQDVIAKNTATLQVNIRSDPVAYNTGGSSLWVMDPWGSCRALILPARLSSYTGAVELSMVPCSWQLQFMCMEFATAQALSAGLTLPHNLYRTPQPPPLPHAVPSYVGGSDGAPPGYRLVRSNVTLGSPVPPAGAIFFSSRATYQQLGPIVNFVGRWRASGLDALRIVTAGDATNVVEQAMANNTVTDFFGDTTPVLTSVQSIAWAATPLPREDPAARVLRTSYVTRLEGCASTAGVQRLLLVNAGGAAAAQGVSRCVSNFAEEVAPGGFLAFVEGYYVDYNNSSLELGLPASIAQLWFVWAVPENYTRPGGGAPLASPDAGTADGGGGAGVMYFSGGVRAVAPRLALSNPTPQCADSRSMIPYEGVIRNRAECGQTSQEQLACPSYMCCGTTRGRVGICGTLASACLLSACDPRYGLCGVVPNEALEVTPHEGILGVAPAPSALSSAPPYTTDFGSSNGSTATTTVRYGASVYVLDKSGTVSYAAAIEACRSQTLYGLSWRLIMLPDAFSYEVTLLGRGEFLALLDNRVAWVQPRPDDTTLGVPGCLTVTWDVDFGSAQLVAVQAAECTSIATVICHATWPAPSRSHSSSSGGGGGGSSGVLRFLSSPPPPAPPANGTSITRWTRGVHSLSTTLIGLGQPNSGNSCVFASFDWLPAAEVVQALNQVGSSQSGAGGAAVAAVPLGINVTLDAPLVGIATRPLVTWSAVVSEPATAYEVVGSIAIQYQLNSTAAPAPPVVLGSLDGTFLGGSASYGAVAPAATAAGPGGGDVASYLSSSAGWHSLQLDLEAGEVVVEVSGCRGGLVEQVLMRTSTGRLWTAPMGPALRCSIPFQRKAPPGGYLVALQVFGGSYVEEMKLVWGTPPSSSWALPPAPSQAGDGGNGGAGTGSIRRLKPAAFGVSVGFAVLVPLLVAGIIVIWWMRRCRLRRRRQSTEAVAAATKLHGRGISSAELSAAAGGGGAAAVDPPGGCLELLAVLVEGARRGAARPVHPEEAPSHTGQQRPRCMQQGGDGSDGVFPDGDTVAAVARLSGGASPRGLRSSSGASPCSDATTHSSTCGNRAGAAPPPLAAAEAALGPLMAAAAPAVGATRLAAVEAAAAPGGGSCGSAIQRLQSSSARPSDEQVYGAYDGMKIVSDGANSCADAGGRADGAFAVGVAGPGLTLSASSARRDSGARDGAAAATGAEAGSPAAVWSTPSAPEGLTQNVVPPIPDPSACVRPGPPMPTPPPGSEAWAQNLHAALFYKVLYHWKPPALGANTTAPGMGAGRVGGGGALVGPAAAATAAVGLAADTAPSPLTTSLAASSIAAPLTSSAADGCSAGSGAVHRSAELPPPTLTMAAATSAAAPAGGTSLSSLRASSSRARGAPCTASGTTATSSAAASVLLEGVWPTAAAAAAVAAAAPGGCVSGADAERRSRSDQAASTAAATPPPPLLLPPNGQGGGASAAVGALLPQAPDGTGGEYDRTDLLLGRDVLVDVEDPSSYLGHGTSGVVRRGLLRQSDGSWRPVAVKLLNQPSDQALLADQAYRRHAKTLLQEITILGSLRHPNIVQLLGGSVSLAASGASFLVEELCGRTLSAAIYDASTPYSLRQILCWCCDIARGLAYLHPNIMHRDLKPSNVLLDQYGTAKISDFGLARFKIHTTLVTRDAEVGTTCYMSPECFVSSDFKVTAATDVYSLGVMINEMVTRQPPWSGVRTAVVGFKVAVVGDRPRLPEEDCPLCPPSLRRLILDCWAQHPEDRPSSAEVLSRLLGLLAEVEVQEAEQEAEGAPAGAVMPSPALAPPPEAAEA